MSPQYHLFGQYSVFIIFIFYVNYRTIWTTFQLFNIQLGSNSVPGRRHDYLQRLSKSDRRDKTSVLPSLSLLLNERGPEGWSNPRWVVSE